MAHLLQRGLFRVANDSYRELQSIGRLPKRGRNAPRRTSSAFTEQGVAMLSTVLRSKQAVQQT